MVDPTRESDRDRQAPPTRRAPSAAVITDARSAASAEISGRMWRYSITMAFRMACFVGMVFVGGWLRWVLLACAVFLPYIAVVLANQADQRTGRNLVERGAPSDAPQLTTGTQADLGSGEVVEGSVVTDVDDPGAADQRDGRRRPDEQPEDRVA